MHAYRGWKQAGFSALLFVLVTALWVLFAPPQMGGATSFVVISGQSMEPLYHTGDLVIVRRAASYEIGDIVAYRAFEERALVIHRIIGREGDRFVFKGDNNSWTDSLKPVQSELLGKAWIHIPKLGRLVRWLRNPLPFSVLAGLFGFALLSITFQEPERPGRKRPGGKFRGWSLRPTAWLFTRPEKESIMKPSRPASPRRSPQKTEAGSERLWSSFLDGAVFLLGFVVLAALLVGLFAFTRPLWNETTGTSAYQQTGTYSYTAAVPESVYDTSALETGQPIFVKLTCRIDLEFAYTLTGNQLGELNGNHHLIARLTEGKTGWSRSFSLESWKTFHGNHFVASAQLDLCRLEELARAMEEQTGLQAFYYTLTIEPQVEIGGTVAGQELQDAFNPALTFQFDPTVFYLLGQNEGTDPLNPVQAGQVSFRQMEPNSLVFFSRSYPVAALRRTAAISFGVSTVFLLAIIGLTWWLGKRSQLAALQLKYGALLVEAETDGSRPGQPVYQVKSMEDLARLAERERVLILHEQDTHADLYSVQTQQAIYRFRLPRAEAAETKPAHPAKSGRAAGTGGRKSAPRKGRKLNE